MILIKKTIPLFTFPSPNPHEQGKKLCSNESLQLCKSFEGGRRASGTGWACSGSRGLRWPLPIIKNIIEIFIFETAIVKHKKKGCCDGIVLMDRGRRLHAHKTWYVLLFETEPAYRDVPTHNATHATHKSYKTIHFLREIPLVFIAHYTHCCGLGALCCEFHTRRYGRRTLEGLSQRERAREKRRCTCILTFFRSFSIYTLWNLIFPWLSQFKKFQ